MTGEIFVRDGVSQQTGEELGEWLAGLGLATTVRRVPAMRGLQIILEPDLPEDALTKLTGLDLAQFRHGPLHYDRAAKRWRSPLDEAES